MAEFFTGYSEMPSSEIAQSAQPPPQTMNPSVLPSYTLLLQPSYPMPTVLPFSQVPLINVQADQEVLRSSQVRARVRVDWNREQCAR